MKDGLSGRAGDWDEIAVETTSLDAMLDCQGEHLAIKVDVEGHDDRVLMGMMRLLERNDCYVQFEISSKRQDNRTFIFERMESLGYRHTALIGKDYIFERA